MRAKTLLTFSVEEGFCLQRKKFEENNTDQSRHESFNHNVEELRFLILFLSGHLLTFLRYRCHEIRSRTKKPTANRPATAIPHATANKIIETILKNLLLFNRGDAIRTHDLLLPKQAL